MRRFKGVARKNRARSPKRIGSTVADTVVSTMLLFSRAYRPTEMKRFASVIPVETGFMGRLGCNSGPVHGMARATFFAG